jgi:hypothetical protein
MHRYMVMPDQVVDAFEGEDLLQADTVRFEGTGDVDGVPIATFFRTLLVDSQGRIFNNGSNYIFYRQNNTTTAFTITVSATGRTRS